MKMLTYLLLSLLFLVAILVIIPAEYFNLVIYMALLAWGLLHLCISYLEYKKLKRGQTCQGRLIEYENEYPNDWVDTVYRLRIEFDNPFDGSTYTISRRQKSRPRKTDSYLVLLDKRNPEHSVVIVPVNFARVYPYVLLVIVAGILAGKEIW